MATQTLRPNAAGDLTQIENQHPNEDEHWDKVDEVSSDGDGTYVDQEVAGPGISVESDLYNLENYSGGTVITNVRVYARWRQVGGVEPFQPFTVLLRTGGLTYLWNFFGIGSNYEDAYRDWATNPDTGDAWTVAEINALQAGIRLQCIVAGGSKWGRCTQIYVVVTYAVGRSQAHII